MQRGQSIVRGYDLTSNHISNDINSSFFAAEHCSTRVCKQTLLHFVYIYTFILVPNTCKRSQVGYKNVQFQTRLCSMNWAYCTRTDHKHFILLKLPTKNNPGSFEEQKLAASMGHGVRLVARNKNSSVQATAHLEQQQRRQGLCHDHVTASQYDHVARLYFYFFSHCHSPRSRRATASGCTRWRR
jgi:hypothetical protein